MSYFSKQIAVWRLNTFITENTVEGLSEIALYILLKTPLFSSIVKIQSYSRRKLFPWFGYHVLCEDIPFHISRDFHYVKLSCLMLHRFEKRQFGFSRDFHYLLGKIPPLAHATIKCQQSSGALSWLTYTNRLALLPQLFCKRDCTCGNISHCILRRRVIVIAFFFVMV